MTILFIIVFLFCFFMFSFQMGRRYQHNNPDDLRGVGYILNNSEDSA